MPLLAIPANDIDVTGLPVDAPLPVDWLTGELSDADVTAVAPGRFQGRLSRSGAADIVVRGRVQATVSTPCARCLGPATIPIAADLSLLLRPEARGDARRGDKETEREITAEEADLDVYDGETVVLDSFLREAILLEMPNFPLCSEACPGIRPAASDRPAEAQPPPDRLAEERSVSIADLRDRFAQRSGRIARVPRGAPKKPK
jgi:uncharacterized protein